MFLRAHHVSAIFDQVKYQQFLEQDADELLNGYSLNLEHAAHENSCHVKIIRKTMS